MLTKTAFKRANPSSFYGSLAFGSIVLSCYTGFFYTQRFYTSEYMVPVTFAFGAVYVALGVLDGHFTDCKGRFWSTAYFVTQCAVLTAIILLSPIRGFIGIMVLPLMSQAIFSLTWRPALAVGLYLFVLDLAVWAWPYGWSGVSEAFLSYTAGFAFTIVFTLVTKQALLAREREEALRLEVEAANRQLRDYAEQAGELATTRERNRLAREIHDGVGHYLTVVKTQLDAATALMPSQPDLARDAVVKAARLTSEALDDVRRSVGSLRTDASRPPLPEALKSLVVDAGLPVIVQVEGAARSLPPAVEHALFRSAQEGLTNVRKHAGATRAEVTLDFRASDRVALVVRDDGRGAGTSRAGGFGLIGLRERVEVLGGDVHTGSNPNGGFVLTVRAPA